MKKTSRRVFSVLLIAMLMVTLTACGGSKGAELKDGTYEAKSDMTDYGYEKALVTVKDGKISEVQLMRMNPDDSEVDYDEWDGTAADGKPNLKEAKDLVAKQIVEKQSTEVDNITGATSSIDNWKVVVDKALEQAK